MISLIWFEEKARFMPSPLSASLMALMASKVDPSHRDHAIDRAVRRFVQAVTDPDIDADIGVERVVGIAGLVDLVEGIVRLCRSSQFPISSTAHIDRLKFITTGSCERNPFTNFLSFWGSCNTVVSCCSVGNLWSCVGILQGPRGWCVFVGLVV